MVSDTGLALQLALWGGLVALIVSVQWRNAAYSCGLVFAYLLNLWMIHWPATLLYLLPWYSFYDPSLIQTGFTQSLYAVVGLAIGVILVGPAVRQLARPRRHAEVPVTGPLSPKSSRLPYQYMMIGLISYFFIFPVSGRIPSLIALVSNANQLLLIGLALACFQAWHLGNKRAFTRCVALMFGFPLVTMLVQGFIGFGVMATLTLLAFLATFVRARGRTIVLGLLVAYFALSVYVTYMRDRTDIRAAVWGGEAIGERVEALHSTFRNFEWFDLGDEAQLRRVDERLNQNWLVGAAVAHLDARYATYAEGETLWTALLSPVPRIFWPGKPIYAGGADLVSAYTGVRFASGTSVGIGQVMEFYINFGAVGVLGGFILLGTLLAIFDRKAAYHLHRGNWQRFTLWYLPGLGFLQAGGSLAEVTATVSAGFVTAFLVTRFLIPFLDATWLARRRGGQMRATRTSFPRRQRYPVMAYRAKRAHHD